MYMYMQENDSDMFCTIEAILTVEQMWSLYPDVLLLYPDTSTYIIRSKQEIPVKVIISISDTPPNQLYRLDHRTKILVPLNGLVMANVFVIMHWEIFTLEA